MEPSLKMSTLIILYLNLVALFVAGQSIHNIASNGVCDLNAFVRVGDILRWENPTNQTIYIKGEQCHTKLSIVIPPKHNARYVFQLRGVCQYRSSACPSELGILNVKASRIQRRSITTSFPTTQGPLCMALCQGTYISLRDITSANLCHYQYAYVVRGDVKRYYTVKSGKEYLELSVKNDYLLPVCSSNCLPTPTYKSSLLWMPTSQNCTCPKFKVGSDLLVMGFRYGTELAFSTTGKYADWDPKMATKLLAYQRKVNRNPPCS